LDFPKSSGTVPIMAEELGTRIRMFRERRGMLARELAEVLDLSEATISEIENNKRPVKAYEIAEIADALGISAIALFNPESFSSSIPVFARVGDSSLSTEKVQRAVRWYADFKEILDPYVQRNLELVDARPRIEIDSDYLEKSKKLAGWCNDNFGDWRGSEDKFMALKLEIEQKFAFDVVLIDAGENEILGASLTSFEFPIIFVNSSILKQRALFTLAHELGHMLSVTDSSLILDHELKDKNSAEKFANAFAAEFLMPSNLVKQSFKTHKFAGQAFEELLRVCGVSWQSLVYRIHNLGIIDASVRSALLQVGAIGYQGHVHRRDNLEVDLLPHEIPLNAAPGSILAEAAKRAFIAGDLGLNPTISMSGFTEEQLINLSPMPDKSTPDRELEVELEALKNIASDSENSQADESMDENRVYA